MRTTSASVGVPSASMIVVLKRATRPLSVISRCISNQSCSSSLIDGSDFVLPRLGEELVAPGYCALIIESYTTREPSPATWRTTPKSSPRRAHPRGHQLAELGELHLVGVERRRRAPSSAPRPRRASCAAPPRAARPAGRGWSRNSFSRSAFCLAWRRARCCASPRAARPGSPAARRRRGDAAARRARAAISDVRSADHDLSSFGAGIGHDQHVGRAAFLATPTPSLKASRVVVVDHPRLLVGVPVAGLLAVEGLVEQRRRARRAGSCTVRASGRRRACPRRPRSCARSPSRPGRPRRCAGTSRRCVTSARVHHLLQRRDARAALLEQEGHVELHEALERVEHVLHQRRHLAGGGLDLDQLRVDVAPSPRSAT